jgi:acetyl/propionyl-CoA carboxylase alpha subunit
MHHAFKLNDAEHNVELSRSADSYRLHVEGRVITFTTWDLPPQVATRGDDVFVHLEGETYHLRYEHPLDRLAHQAHGAAEDGLRAPMPGSLVTVHVKPGQAVGKGEALLVMESMKMETTLVAARDGVVAEVHFAPAQTFDRDALLLTLEPVGAPLGATDAAVAAKAAPTKERP